MKHYETLMEYELRVQCDGTVKDERIQTLIDHMWEDQLMPTERIATAVTAVRSENAIARIHAIVIAGHLTVFALPLVSDLLLALEDDDETVSHYAEMSLWGVLFENPPSVDIVLDALRRRQLRRPERSLEALAFCNISRADAIPLCIDYLERGPEAARRASASLIGALGSVGSDAIPVLSRLLALPLRTSRRGVAIALGRIGENGLAVLNAGLDSEDEQIREYACVGICESQAHRPDLIIPMLNHKDARLRRIAAKAIAPIPVLFSDAESRDTAIKASDCKTTEDSIPILAQLLNDEDAGVQLAAAQALSHIDPHNARVAKWVVPAILHESDLFRAVDTVFVVAQIGKPAGILKKLRRVATDLSQDNDVRQRAVDALTTLSGDSAESLLAMDGVNNAAWDAEGTLLRDELLFLQAVLRSYERGADSFTKVAEQLKRDLDSGKHGLPVSVAEITRCVERLNAFFSKVFKEPALTLFNAPKGVKATRNEVAFRALEWIEGFMRRNPTGRNRAAR